MTTRNAAPAAPPGSAPAGRFGLPIALATLAAVTAVAFAGSLRNGWIVLDDPAYITENPHVLAGWTLAGLRWFLHVPHGGNWHPLTSYSHMLDVQLFGVNPGAHHAVSLALHACNVLLLVVVLYRLTGDRWRSVLAGALFGLHPLRVESVAWASERKDVLSMFFFMLTIEAYRRWVVRPGAMRYAAIVLMLALGLMSKPMLVSTPFVLLLLDVWPLRRLEKRSLPSLAFEKWPLFLLAAASALVTIIVQRGEGAIVSSGHATIPHRLANAAVSYWRYMGKTAWPVRLAPFYPDAPIAPGVAIVCAASLIAISALAWRQRRRQPHLTVGWLWYVVTLLPVIGLIQVGGQAYADRYTYIPTIGLLIALVWTRVPRRFELPAWIAGAVAAVALLVLTRRQVALWKDTRTLFTHTLRVTHDNAMAHDCLGSALMSEQSESQAMREFDAAIRINPAFINPYRNRAELLHRQGRDEEAVRDYEIVRGTQPGDAELAAGEARALLQLGVGLAARHRVSEALSFLRRAETLSPLDAGSLSPGCVRCGTPASSRPSCSA